MKRLLALGAMSAALFMSSCDNAPVKYDPKGLGFSSQAEMEAAFAKGYQTKQKLDEMTKPASASPASAPQVAGPAGDGAFSPSFDCAKATTAQERMICGDQELAGLDVSLHQAYVKARDAAPDKQQVLESQRAWLRNSFSACTDKDCLRTAYTQRIAELNR